MPEAREGLSGVIADRGSCPDGCVTSSADVTKGFPRQRSRRLRQGKEREREEERQKEGIPPGFLELTLVHHSDQYTLSIDSSVGDEEKR